MCIPTHNIKKEWVVADRKIFAIEVSELGIGFYNSATNELKLRNPDRDTTSTWTLVNVEGIDETKESELLCWNFGPTYESIKSHPNLKGWRLKVFNN